MKRLARLPFQLTTNSSVVQTCIISPATRRVYRHVQAYTVLHSHGAVKSLVFCNIQCST